MVNFFGFQIRRADETANNQPESFAPEVKDDGAVVVAAGGAYGTYIDLDGTSRTETELVSKYREISLDADIEMAIDDIINESIDTDADDIVTINMEDAEELSDQLKEIITKEFEYVLELLNFKNEAYEIFKRWYVDGRMYYHVIIDEKNIRAGIKEMRYIDPRKIRKVREVKRQPKGPIIVNTTKREYYVYNDRSYLPAGGNAGMPMDNGSTAGLRIALDSIVHVTSGLVDKNNQLVYSHLQKAIKPLNQLRVMEDSTVIYRISRAPERRIFYIDVGNLPKAKAEQYLRDMMVRHKNRLVYDASTGEVRDDRKFMTMMEDYWLPRREGNRGTEITTLPAGQNLGEMGDVEYFQKKLYQSLNVPMSRLQQGESGFNLGRAAEITRDEVKFTKFVGRLRRRFAHLFYKTLSKQLILKGIVNEQDWQELENVIRFDFALDNHFKEFKDAEVMNNRLDLLSKMQPYIGTVYSYQYVMREVLKMTDEEIEEMQGQIQVEGGPGPTGLNLDQEAQMAQLQQPPAQPAGAKPKPK